jgi:hypothetical protein
MSSSSSEVALNNVCFACRNLNTSLRFKSGNDDVFRDLSSWAVDIVQLYSKSSIISPLTYQFPNLSKSAYRRGKFICYYLGSRQRLKFIRHQVNWIFTYSNYMLLKQGIGASCTNIITNSGFPVAWPNLRVHRDINSNPASEESFAFVENLFFDCSR